MDFSDQSIMVAVSISWALTRSSALRLALCMLKRHNVDLEEWEEMNVCKGDSSPQSRVTQKVKIRSEICKVYSWEAGKRPV